MLDKNGVSNRTLFLILGRKLAQSLKTLVFSVLYHGHARWCPVCEKSSRKFLRFGEMKREDACCPRCGALERHRLTWIFFLRKIKLFNGQPKRMLHVAPEPCLASRLKRRLGGGYLSADLLDPAAMVRMDVTAILFPEASFDAIYCSHVLEHVEDDRRAMREFFRVLKPGGWAVFLVPVASGRTIEDPGIVDPAARRKAFGQEDHVRRYGSDFMERLSQAGFQVDSFGPEDLCGETEARRLGLTESTGRIYRGIKI